MIKKFININKTYFLLILINFSCSNQIQRNMIRKKPPLIKNGFISNRHPFKDNKINYDRNTKNSQKTKPTTTLITSHRQKIFDTIYFPIRGIESNIALMKVYSTEYLDFIFQLNLKKLRSSFQNPTIGNASILENIELLNSIKFLNYINLEQNFNSALKEFGVQFDNKKYLDNFYYTEILIRLKYLLALSSFNYLYKPYCKYNPLLCYRKEIKWLKSKLYCLIYFGAEMNLECLYSCIIRNETPFYKYIKKLNKFITDEKKDEISSFNLESKLEGYDEIYLILESLFDIPIDKNFLKSLKMCYRIKGSFTHDRLKSIVILNTDKNNSWLSLMTQPFYKNPAEQIYKFNS